MNKIMKYKVGDRVRIKSLDWYNENKKKELRSCIECGKMMFTPQISKWCGKIVTIIRIENDCYMDENAYYWTDEMIEGKVEEIKPKFKVGDRVKWYNHTCNITAIDTDKDIYTYLIKHNDYREDKTFAKWVPENELTFEDEET